MLCIVYHSSILSLDADVKNFSGDPIGYDHTINNIIVKYYNTINTATIISNRGRIAFVVAVVAVICDETRNTAGT